MGSLNEIDVGKNAILSILAPNIRKLFLSGRAFDFKNIEEIRLRCGKPVMIRCRNREYCLNSSGSSGLNHNTYCVTREDVMRTIAAISDNSLYAFDEDIKRGFITIPGGHRVGLAGQVLVQEQQVKNIKDFSSICIRVAREIKNCADEIVPAMGPPAGRIFNSLLVSPPRCGKTTILRDIARQLSSGSRNIRPQNVVIVDERSEIAGCYLGIPQLDVGPRTDVLDSCPKAAGMIMAVRAMAPDVVLTDEIGRREDVEAVQECVNAGVSLVSSVHAGSLEELEKRPIMKELLTRKSFQTIILLSRRRGPGTVEKIVRWD